MCWLGAEQIAKLRSQDIADLILYGTDCVEAELEAARVAADTGATYVSPYNDLQVRLLPAANSGLHDT